MDTYIELPRRRVSAEQVRAGGMMHLFRLVEVINRREGEPDISYFEWESMHAVA